MKYSREVIINLPRKRVIELFDSSKNLKKWQPTLISYKHLSGIPGKVGAKMQLNYKMGKREVEMVETIVKNELPQAFVATYETKSVWNIVNNKFSEASDSTTKWELETEFKCKGMMKLMTAFMPGLFKKETEKNMNQFKTWAEAQ